MTLNGVVRKMPNKLRELIGHLMSTFFYGKLTICFENGKIVRIIKEESIKL
jgi:hypothetical protein